VAKSLGANQFIAITGGLLACLGLAVSATLRISSFARYMWYEDLGLDVNPSVSPELFRQIVAATPTDKSLFYFAVALIPVGLFLIVLAVVRHKKAAGGTSQWSADPQLVAEAAARGSRNGMGGVGVVFRWLVIDGRAGSYSWRTTW
jgi:hypothetical protein